jgi:hypothetical protein
MKKYLFFIFLIVGLLVFSPFYSKAQQTNLPELKPIDCSFYSGQN